MRLKDDSFEFSIKYILIDSVHRVFQMEELLRIYEIQAKLGLEIGWTSAILNYAAFSSENPERVRTVVNKLTTCFEMSSSSLFLEATGSFVEPGEDFQERAAQALMLDGLYTAE